MPKNNSKARRAERREGAQERKKLSDLIWEKGYAKPYTKEESLRIKEHYERRWSRRQIEADIVDNKEELEAELSEHVARAQTVVEQRFGLR